MNLRPGRWVKHDGKVALVVQPGRLVPGIGDGGQPTGQQVPVAVVLRSGALALLAPGMALIHYVRMDNGEYGGEAVAEEDSLSLPTLAELPPSRAAHITPEAWAAVNQD